MSFRGCENMVEIKIDFEELLIAFESSNMDNHFFIDLEKSEMVNINEFIDLDSSDKLEELDDDSVRYLSIPGEFQWNEKILMETFVYGLDDLDVADDFINTLQRRKPFKNFKLLLDEHNLREKWYDYRENEIKNQLINWLVETDIKLIGQEEKMIKKIEITELGSEETNKLDDEIKSLLPIVCTNCDYRGNFNRRIFSINLEPENKLDEIQVKEIMNRKSKVMHFGTFVGEKGQYLTAAKCPKCNSDDVFWDY